MIRLSDSVEFNALSVDKIDMRNCDLVALVVAPDGDDLLSLGRLLRQGFRFNLLLEKLRDHEQGLLHCPSFPGEELVAHATPDI